MIPEFGKAFREVGALRLRGSRERKKGEPGGFKLTNGQKSVLGDLELLKMPLGLNAMLEVVTDLTGVSSVVRPRLSRWRETQLESLLGIDKVLLVVDGADLEDEVWVFDPWPAGQLGLDLRHLAVLKLKVGRRNEAGRVHKGVGKRV